MPLQWTQGYSAGAEGGGGQKPLGGPELTSCPHSSPAEASQQMAELSEVLVLRMENYDLQQKEVTQLRTQVTSLQERCQLVRRGVWETPSLCHGPKGPFPCPCLLELSAQPGPRPETQLEETSEIP